MNLSSSTPLAPPAPSSNFPRGAARPPLWLLLLLCAGVLVARRPDAFYRPQLWAEDGIFFHQAYELGYHAFFAELAGYFHLVPRIVAALAVAVDPHWAPHVFVGSALVGTLYVAARLCSGRCPLPLPGACVLALVLVPDAGEVLLTIANLQWILAGSLILLLLSDDPGDSRAYLHDVIAGFILGLTGPFSVALAPLFLLRAWQRRTPASLVICAVVLICAVIQLVSIVRHPLPVPPDPTVDFGALASVPGIRVGGTLLLGVFLPKNPPVALAALFTALTLGAILILALRPGALRRERLWLALALLALLASSLVRYRYTLPSLCVPGNGSRYFFAVQFAALWLLLSTAVLGRRSARAVALVCIVMLLTNFSRLREGPFTDYHWDDYVPRIRAGEAVTIPINPGGWPIQLPARRR
ncbi:MAG: hypothetical protein NTV51_07770 [Verrucomicrobia bacterium]|nr:hypothetical protein [Verrucomicrobiota bacterium]